jgi:hypothetical protein
MFMLAGCAKAPSKMKLPALVEFTGRLIVIEPARRWQVLVTWHSLGKNEGWLRLSHAATGRIIELRWRSKMMWLRDNQAELPDWQMITLQDLRSYGISLFPNDIALFLAGETPPDFNAAGENMWRGKRMDHTLHVKWVQSKRQLRITDVTMGKIFILMIDA